MNSPQLASNQHYTAADYATWNDGRRYELLQGGVRAMSPATAKLDWNDKFKLYEAAGVREYWIVHPEEQFVHVFRLVDGKFQFNGAYFAEDSVKIGIFEDVTIDLKNVFENDIA